MRTNPTNNAEPGNDLEWPDVVDPSLPKLSDDGAPHERRRSQRVTVQVAVLLRAEAPRHECGPLPAFAASVNAHGGLLLSPRRVRAGQKITLVIPQSGKEAVGRVLQSQMFSEASFATIFQFDKQSPRFWPVASPPPDWSVVSAPQAAPNYQTHTRANPT